MSLWKTHELYQSLDEKLTPEYLEMLSEDELIELNDFISEKEDWYRYNKLATFKPYPYQLEYYSAALSHRQRYLSCSNRIGKSYGMAAEMAQHLCGDYAPWWNGYRFENGGEIFWCIGLTQESTNGVLMKELLGVSDCRNLIDLGTGSVPREYIDVDSMVKDGERCKSVRIKHASGKDNILHFYAATQGPMVLAGQTVGGMIWMDEQSPQEMEIYDQARTRTMTTKGHIAVTATPELGPTELWQTFHDDESGLLYMQTATWWDAHEKYVEGGHITDAIIDEQRASCSPHKFQMRSKGIPVMGEGAVYDFGEDAINTHIHIDEILNTPFAYKMLWGCDFGYAATERADPSTLILCAYKMENDTIYVVDEWNSKKDMLKVELPHQPAHMAKIIKESKFPNAPLICPHDGNGSAHGDNTTRIAEFKSLGINVIPKVFEIPKQLTKGAIGAPSHPRSLEWTIQYLNTLFSQGKLKIDVNKLQGLMKEYRTYQWKENGKPVDKNNHHLDAMRYAVVTIKHRGLYASHCLHIPTNRWAESSDIDNRMKSRRF